jgi:LAO/AO transport system kinase
MELADLIVINKADLDADAATRARAQIAGALRLLGLHGNPEQRLPDVSIWHPQVLQISALKFDGLVDVWAAATRFRELQTASGRLAARRHAQDHAWMWQRIEAGLRQRFREHPAVKAALPAIESQVRSGSLAASVAARRLLDLTS